MYQKPVKIVNINVNSTITATGSVVVGNRTLSNGNFVYDGDTLTVSCSAFPSHSVDMMYTLNSLTTGSWTTEYNVFLAPPYFKRVDYLSVTGSLTETGSTSAYRLISINNLLKQ